MAIVAAVALAAVAAAFARHALLDRAPNGKREENAYDSQDQY